MLFLPKWISLTCTAAFPPLPGSVMVFWADTEQQWPFFWISYGSPSSSELVQKMEERCRRQVGLETLQVNTQQKNGSISREWETMLLCSLQALVAFVVKFLKAHTDIFFPQYLIKSPIQCQCIMKHLAGDRFPLMLGWTIFLWWNIENWQWCGGFHSCHPKTSSWSWATGNLFYHFNTLWVHLGNPLRSKCVTFVMKAKLLWCFFWSMWKSCQRKMIPELWICEWHLHTSAQSVVLLGLQTGHTNV